MYRRPKFLEVLLEIRQEMAREADYDLDLFAELVRSGQISSTAKAAAKKTTPAADTPKRESKRRK